MKGWVSPQQDKQWIEKSTDHGNDRPTAQHKRKHKHHLHLNMHCLGTYRHMRKHSVLHLCIQWKKLQADTHKHKHSHLHLCVQRKKLQAVLTLLTQRKTLQAGGLHSKSTLKVVVGG